MADILIIDDEPALRRIMVIVLNRSGFSTEEAADGAIGLACFRAAKPRLVITDMTMPSRGGLSVIAEIRQSEPGLPVLAISGGGDPDLFDRALANGATEVLAKPFKPAQLLETVNRLLGTP